MPDTPRPRSTVTGEPPHDGYWDATAPAPIDAATGQHADHYVLPEPERAEPPVRPLRLSYKHLKCGTVTQMPRKCAETYSVRPTYYSHTFCCHCRDYLPVGQFVWLDDGSCVGS